MPRCLSGSTPPTLISLRSALSSLTRSRRLGTAAKSRSCVRPCHLLKSTSSCCFCTERSKSSASQHSHGGVHKEHKKWDVDKSRVIPDRSKPRPQSAANSHESATALGESTDYAPISSQIDDSFILTRHSAHSAQIQSDRSHQREKHTSHWAAIRPFDEMQREHESAKSSSSSRQPAGDRLSLGPSENIQSQTDAYNESRVRRHASRWAQMTQRKQRRDNEIFGSNDSRDSGRRRKKHGRFGFGGDKSEVCAAIEELRNDGQLCFSVAKRRRHLTDAWRVFNKWFDAVKHPELAVKTHDIDSAEMGRFSPLAYDYSDNDSIAEFISSHRQRQRQQVLSHITMDSDSDSVEPEWSLSRDRGEVNEMLNCCARLSVDVSDLMQGLHLFSEYASRLSAVIAKANCQSDATQQCGESKRTDSDDISDDVSRFDFYDKMSLATKTSAERRSDELDFFYRSDQWQRPRLSLDVNATTTTEQKKSADAAFVKQLRHRLNIAYSHILNGCHFISHAGFGQFLADEFVAISLTAVEDAKGNGTQQHIDSKTLCSALKAYIRCNDKDALVRVTSDTRLLPANASSMDAVFCHLVVAQYFARQIENMESEGSRGAVAMFCNCIEKVVRCFKLNTIIRRKRQGNGGYVDCDESESERIPVFVLEPLCEILARMGLVPQCIRVLNLCGAELTTGIEADSESTADDSSHIGAADTGEFEFDFDGETQLTDLHTFEKWLNWLIHLEVECGANDDGTLKTVALELSFPLVSAQMWYWFPQCLLRVKDSSDPRMVGTLLSQICFRHTYGKRDSAENDPNLPHPRFYPALMHLTTSLRMAETTKDAEEEKRSTQSASVEESEDGVAEDFTENSCDEIVSVSNVDSTDGSVSPNSTSVLKYQTAVACLNECAHYLNTLSSDCRGGYGIGWHLPAARLLGVLHPFDAAFPIHGTSLRRRGKWQWQRQMAAERRHGASKSIASAQRSTDTNTVEFADSTRLETKRVRSTALSQSLQCSHRIERGPALKRQSLGTAAVSSVPSSVLPEMSSATKRETEIVSLLTGDVLNSTLQCGLQSLAKGNTCIEQKTAYCKWILYRFGKLRLKPSPKTVSILGQHEVDSSIIDEFHFC